MNRICNIITILLATSAATTSWSHDTYEITLEVKERKSEIVLQMEMALSTSVAALDPSPSLGYLYEPDQFSEWKEKYETAGPELMRLSDSEGTLKLVDCQSRLSREDDVIIEYTFVSGQSGPLSLEAPILNRFPQEGYGIQVTYRDRAGKWMLPVLVKQDDPRATLSTDH